jgi:hypothetical protein
MNSSSPRERPLQQTEQERLVFLETELELAFTFLRLAEAESSGGNLTHAAELIAKANVTHKAALKYLGNLPLDWEAKRELHLNIRRLREAIRASGRRTLLPV